jgi:two-component system, cell cycle response regulator
MRLFPLKLRARAGQPWGMLELTGSLPTFHELRPFMERELRRARRYERPLSVLVIALDPAPAPTSSWLGARAEALRNEMAAQLSFFHMGSLLRDSLRETDMAGFVAETQEFVALLPEMELPAARRTAERLNGVFSRRTSAGVRIAAADFPSAGLTLPDILGSARAALNEGDPGMRISANG